MTEKPSPSAAPQAPAGRFVRVLDRLAGNPTRIMVGLGAVCAALAVGDLLYHKHATISAEAWPFFYPVFGFVVYVAVIFAAKTLRLMIRRPEDYYGKLSTDAETPNEHMTGGRP